MKKYSIYFAGLIAAAAAIYAYMFFLRTLDVFLWDESHHGVYAMWIYDSIKAHNLEYFWSTTNRQALWMPLHSWVSALFLLIFGFSYSSARLSSLFLFFCSAIMLYKIGEKTLQDKGWLVGLIPVVLFCASPMMLHLGTVHMQEMLGIFLCLLITYFIISWRFDAVKYLVLGLMLGVCYWAKQNFAVIIGFGVLLWQLSVLWDVHNQKASPETPPAENKRAKKKETARLSAYDQLLKNKYFAWLMNDLLILAGSIPLPALWWLTPPFERKFDLGIAFRQQTGTISGFGSSFFSGILGTIVYYAQSIITSYNISFWFGILSLAAFFASFFFYKDIKIRVISLMFLASLVFLSIIAGAQERYISTAFPLLFVLLAFFMVMAAERLNANTAYRAAAYVISVFLLATFVYDVSQLTRYTKEVGNRSIEFLIYQDSLNKFSPPFLFGAVARPSFSYPVSLQKTYPDFKEKPVSHLYDVLNFFNDNVPADKSISTMISTAQISPYVIYWHFHDRNAPVFSVNDMAVVRDNFFLSDYFLGMDISPDSPYATDIYEQRWKDISAYLLKKHEIKLAVSKDFKDIGIKANIYKRVGF